MPIENFIIEIYVFVDNLLQRHQKIRSRVPFTSLSDSELITIEVVGEFLG